MRSKHCMLATSYMLAHKSGRQDHTRPAFSDCLACMHDRGWIGVGMDQREYHASIKDTPALKSSQSDRATLHDPDGMCFFCIASSSLHRSGGKAVQHECISLGLPVMRQPVCADTPPRRSHLRVCARVHATDSVR